MSRKVLLVDDEPRVLNSLERILNRVDCTCLKANGGIEAIETLKAHDDIALIICDQKMPDLCGAVVLREARRIRPAAIRMALTGFSDAETMMEAINVGQVSRLMLKPWDDDSLIEAVNESLAAHEMLAGKGRVESDPKIEDLIRDRTETMSETLDVYKSALAQVIGVLSSLADLHAAGLRGHSERVADSSRRIAEEIGLPAVETEQIEIAGLLHDIGKISMPQSVISKPDNLLSDKERSIKSRHPLVGYRMLEGISGLEAIADLVRHHHEGVMGHGYPDRLVGAQIPLGARIIAIADTYDRKLYLSDSRIVCSPEEALVKVEDLAGATLDIELVSVFVEIIRRTDLTVPRAVDVLVSMLRPGMILAENVENFKGDPELTAGTLLDSELIDGLTGNDELDPVLSRICVAWDSIPSGSMASTDSSEEAPLKDPSKSKIRKIIVVDDEERVIKALSRELRSAGYEVRGFTCALEGLDHILKAEDLYAVISDFQMPEINGDEFISQVHQVRPYLPCVVITAHATVENVNQLIDSGCPVRILAKPWNKVELLETLESWGEVLKP